MATLKDTIVLGKLSVLGGIHSSQTISGNNIELNGTLTATTICTNAIRGKDSANNACFLYPTGAGWQLYNNRYSGNILPGSDMLGCLGASSLMFEKTYTKYLEVMNINKYLAVYSKSLSTTTTNQLLWEIPNGTCGKLIISSNTEYAIYNLWQGTSSSKFTVEYSSFKSSYITPSLSSQNLYIKMSNSSGNQTIYAILLAVHNKDLSSKANAGIS